MVIRKTKKNSRKLGKNLQNTKINPTKKVKEIGKKIQKTIGGLSKKVVDNYIPYFIDLVDNLLDVSINSSILENKTREAKKYAKLYLHVANNTLKDPEIHELFQEMLTELGKLLANLNEFSKKIIVQTNILMQEEADTIKRSVEKVVRKVTTGVIRGVLDAVGVIPAVGEVVSAIEAINDVIYPLQSIFQESAKILITLTEKLIKLEDELAIPGIDILIEGVEILKKIMGIQKTIMGKVDKLKTKIATGANTKILGGKKRVFKSKQRKNKKIRSKKSKKRNRRKKKLY